MAAIKIALMGEGKNDYGIVGRDGEWEEGAIQPLIRKFFPEADFEDAKRNPENPRQFKIPTKKFPKLKFTAAKLVSYSEYIATSGNSIDLLIFYVDLDKRDMEDEISNLESAFASLREQFGLKAIPMIPMRMLENWLLADENAFESCFGYKPHKPKLPAKPESIWGAVNDPKSEYPKHYLRRVLEQYKESSSTKNFILIAEAANLDTMIRRLPHSFAPFAQRMKNFAAKHL